MEYMIDKLDELDLKKRDFFQEKVKTGNWRAGDILIYQAGSDSAAGEASMTGHTAVLSNVENYVIEASKTGKNGAKVFHWDVSNLWKGASGIKQYEVTSLFGTPADNNKKQIAVNFGLEQVGKPYSFKSPIFMDNGWYCSKLTFRQWFKAGYELGGSLKIVVSPAFSLLVTPFDIAIDANTRAYYNWGRDLPKPL